MQKIFFTIILLSLCCTLQAQVFLEKVYLNDSTTVYEGLIIEQSPAKYVKIFRNKEKDTIMVLLKDIWKLTKEYPPADTSKPVKPTKATSSTGKAIYLEVLGIAGVYSINYDARIRRGHRDGFGVRTGLEVCNIRTINYYGDTLKYYVFGFPLMLNYLYGKKRNFLELGAGVTYFLRLNRAKEVAPSDEYTIADVGVRIPKLLGSFMIGYRYAPINKGITFGISVNPLIGNDYRYPSAGIKIGYKFS